MRSLPWFRFYHESLDDPKVQRLEPTLYKAWVNLLCLAARHGGELPGVEDVAFALRLTIPQCEEVLTELCNGKLLDGEATLAPHNWRNRQPASDADSTVAERQQRYRQRHRETGENAEGQDGSNALRNALRSQRTDAFASSQRRIVADDIDGSDGANGEGGTADRERQQATTRGNGGSGAADSNALRHALRNPARTEQNRTEQNRVNQAAPAAPVAAAAAPAQAPEPVEVVATEPEPTGRAPKTNKLSDVIDAIKDAGGEVSTSSRDGKAVRECSAPAALIAEAYLAASSGAWGDDFTRRNLSLWFICSRIDGYRAHASQARASPASGNGYESYDSGGGVMKVRQVDRFTTGRYGRLVQS